MAPYGGAATRFGDPRRALCLMHATRSSPIQVSVGLSGHSASQDANVEAFRTAEIRSCAGDASAAAFFLSTKATSLISQTENF